MTRAAVLASRLRSSSSQDAPYFPADLPYHLDGAGSPPADSRKGFDLETGQAALAEMLDRLASERDAAWACLFESSHEVVRRLAGRLRLQSADLEDVRDVVFLRAVVDDFAALRRGPPGAQLAAWLTGIARNVLRERRRNEQRAAIRPMEEADGAAVRSGKPSPALRRRTKRSALDLLTPRQRSVVTLLIDGLSESRVAAELGMTRHRVHDVKRRAIARLAKGEPYVAPLPDDDRSWASAAAEAERARSDETNARVLELFAAGATRAEIALATGLTSSAVKERIHRRRPRR